MIRSRRNLTGVFLLSLILIFGIFLLPYNEKASATVPYTNTRVSLDSSGNQISAGTGTGFTSLSKDGRYVLFFGGPGIVTGDTNNVTDAFVRDTQLNTTTRVSVSSSGTEANKGTQWGKISYDGRYVVFVTDASNLVANDNNAGNDVFLRDMQNNTTELVSATAAGTSGNNHSGSENFAVSKDGRYVAFSSAASNLVSGDTNGYEDIFVRDRKLNTTTRLNIGPGGAQGNGFSRNVSMSCDGAIVSFVSGASNLVSSDTNGKNDTFIVDRIGGNTITNVTGVGNGNTQHTPGPSVSCDGSTVTFVSDASNLVAGDTNLKTDVFAYSIPAQSIEAASITSSGTIGNNISEMNLNSVSGDGRYVTFYSYATNLVAGDTNAVADVFIRDRKLQITERVSMINSTTQSTLEARGETISPDGSKVAFGSSDAGFVSGDTNGRADTFLALTGADPCSL